MQQDDPLSHSLVALERAGGYDDPEELRRVLRRLGAVLGWASGAGGAFDAIVPAGARVLVKPNLVAHENQAPFGLEPVVTHTSIIMAVVRELLASGAGSVLIGDAPLQACDWPALLQNSGLGAECEALQQVEPRFLGVRDFRRTVSRRQGSGLVQDEDRRGQEHYVLFDLAEESLLEPVSVRPREFRVTMYDPDKLARTHGPGRHCYLVAREIVEATVIVNLPKLKTHKKAGVTCALKNLIGINGNKEFLPHHRPGSPATGGDCYPHRASVRALLEWVLDQSNSQRGGMGKPILSSLADLLARVNDRTGDELGVEGAWSGNDTIWRTCLDLNRILLYGRLDGTMADAPQRRVLNITDAITAGQGDGPLWAEPLSLGLILASASSAATDLVGTMLLGYDFTRIPSSREAFGRFRWPLTAFPASDVRVSGTFGDGLAEELLAHADLPKVKYPPGWRDCARSVDGKSAR